MEEKDYGIRRTPEKVSKKKSKKRGKKQRKKVYEAKVTIGKPLSEWREESNYFSGKASEAIRTLAFGGLAIVWLFKQDVSNGPTLPSSLLVPVILFALSLGLDLFHYVSGAIIWYRFLISQEESEEVTDETRIVAPAWKRDVVSGFFYFKVAFLVLAYIVLFVNLIGILF